MIDTPQLSAWQAVAAGVVTAVFTPIWLMYRAWVKEEREHRRQLAVDAAAAKPSQAVPAAITAPVMGGSMLSEALTGGQIVEALEDIAAAIREGTQAEGERARDRIAAAVEKLVEHERQERDEHQPARRGGR